MNLVKSLRLGKYFNTKPAKSGRLDRKHKGFMRSKNMEFKHTQTPFSPDSFYHIYNKGNSKENIFFQERNYTFFLSKYEHYLIDLTETYSYCLIPNHFHLLIKIKSENELIPNHEIVQIDKNVTEKFRIFLMGYVKAINKQEKREGSLFKRNLQIKPVIHDNHLRSLIAYIHINPVHHYLTKDFENYKWSSYRSLLSDKPTKLNRKEVIELFDGIENFKEYHETYKNHKDISEMIEGD